MTTSEKKELQNLIESLRFCSEAEQREMLWVLSDTQLWDLWRLGFKEALIVLYKKYHRLVVIRIYKRYHDKMDISLVLIEDAFSEFMEKILNGKYKNEPLRKNFEAFSTYHTVFLVRKKVQKNRNKRIGSFENNGVDMPFSQQHLLIEKGLDFGKVLDCIPLISNRLYRNLVYSIFIMGYTVADLIPVFGERNRAYDKKYRAMEAFKKVLKKEGLWEELK